MSEELEGWTPDGKGVFKLIGEKVFQIRQLNTSDNYQLMLGPRPCATRPTLAECQRLAHATARLWKG